MSKMIRTRFAPSPTGFLHVGSIYTAQFSYAFAKKHGGDFIFRLEDTDRTRYVEGSEEVIREGLEWAGLIPDEGPETGGEYGPYKQSERLDLYRKYAEELIEKEKAYYCFCSQEDLNKMRKKQQERGKPPMYDRTCLGLPEGEVEKRLAEGDPHVIRLKVPRDETIVFKDSIRGEISIEGETVDDQVLLKSDGFPTYHLAVVVDDHLMEISHVIRAEEWISSTPKHIILYKAFGWDIPEHAHVPLIRNKDKSKMSKRHGHAELRWYQDEGYLPEALTNYLALLGWSHPEEKEIFSREEFIKEFTLERVKTTGPIFDLEKLTWMNGAYIREMSDEDLMVELTSRNADLNEVGREKLLQVVSLEKERLKTLNDFGEKTRFFFNDIKADEDVIVQKKRSKEETVKVLEKSMEIVEGVGDWSEESLDKAFDELVEEFPDWSKRDLFMTIRGAVSGQTATPPLFDTLEVLGRGVVEERLEQGLVTLN